ncbi:MAG: hypothetical protein KME45_09185 [Stenomitos rutilans HA7619-LM2]|jgi:hypothetical protein|nr:hypothetical protein [Stenomitos rutilans HA7619-LM2]
MLRRAQVPVNFIGSVTDAVVETTFHWLRKRFPNGLRQFQIKKPQDRLPYSALKVQANRKKSSVGVAFPKGRGLQASGNPF